MNAAPTHQQTARWLMAISGTLGHRERKFIGAMCRISKPSPYQAAWLAKLARRVERCAKQEITDA